MRTAPLLAGAAALLALTGCATATPSSSPPPPTATAAPEPTETPAPEPHPEATSRVPADCDALVPAEVLGEVLSAPVSAVDPLEVTLAAYPAIPMHAAVFSRGGLVCDWTNGEPLSTPSGDNPAHVSLHLELLPGAAAQWEKLAGYYDIETDRAINCPDSMPGYCDVQALLGEYGVHLAGYGIADDARADIEGTVDALLASIADLGASDPQWQAPRAEPELPSCEAMFDPGLMAQLGLPGEGGPGGGGGWSIAAGAREDAGDAPCAWTPPDGEPVAWVDTMRGGAWLADRAQQIAGAPELELAGLREHDAAFFTCRDSCRLNLVLGTSWISLHVGFLGTTQELDPNTRAIAELIVSRTYDGA